MINYFKFDFDFDIKLFLFVCFARFLINILYLITNWKL